ncbi:MAG: phosphoglycerate kinase [Omnitrophica bacterium RIFCSPLOWO2_12_FULL_44_17]|uniref:Phosphoglycerate kinase n=1 Tax=Candidatus Danuiimicrobium aquiferis TaxID=1801832 RepID=A0A1G1KYG2_9BACT|nr:MAG: phosphoglycerate kinase [Omnitrophica bacterium RIFCSPHIGHO2_02_FULL_45_28]OGW91118.1 MAG: phosphoglycerate kinase [Omnitrophica bacterium RIFCSPHIGHO2_12_FULL_44_12]OGW97965.1 MAG: phosphoglycerate kinase [Omnitrophica bacterium RIFCSPLOWO2_12_FULL_44_17]
MNKKTIENIDVRGKRVIARVDYNVPIEGDKITDDARIVKTLPTVKYLIKQKAKIILMAHLGRPKGKKDPKYTLKPVADHLAKLLGQPVKFVPDCIGEIAQRETANLKEGEVVLLENLRFYAEEEKNDDNFSKQLASLGEVYVNDAFGAAHRAHSSTAGIAKYLPAVAGYLLAKEIEYFDKALQNPEKPFLAILGGAKVVDKIKVIENLMTKVDSLLIGGAMAYTFLKAQGHTIGKSLFDAEGFDVAKSLLEKAKQMKIQMLFPVDHVISDKVEAGAPTQLCGIDIPEGKLGVDIGPKTVDQFTNVLKNAKTVIWNGPLGVFEIPAFSNGTKKIAEFLGDLKQATRIVGGGETAAACTEFGVEEKMSHVSTGGGASLEYLEGKVLPGVDALLNK